MVGKLVSSKAGHDKASIYIVIEEDSNNVYVADGKTKTVDCLKKKNKKHIQIINKVVDSELQKKLIDKDPIRNEEIKRAIKLYKQSI